MVQSKLSTTNGEQPHGEITPVASQTENVLIVGIGASAGGLEACRSMIRNIKNTNACFVLCQHLSPTHESRLTEILSRDTDLKVRQIKENDSAKVGYLYIAPPNADLEIRGNMFFLSPPKKGPYPKPNINKFFNSLAENSGDQAIAVILSGTGSDGAASISSIKGHGGVTLVQDPNLSGYDGMPNASIATHMVDMIASAEDIGKQLNNIINDGNKEQDTNSDEAQLVYDSILKLISQKTNIDFTQYKQSTIKRRIARRIAIKGITSLEEYYELIMANSEEIWSFTQDAFIIVSEFYRDIEDFNFFKSQLLKYIAKMPNKAQLRIWVAGCATGDEAYTLAMLLEDLKQEERLIFEYKILATDISEKAIKYARNATYQKEKLANTPNHWIKDYFEETSNDFQIRRHIRERVIFSVHNIFSDPPFSKLDIITCRNLLIYFDAHLQMELTRLFHYSLNESGLLFLGSSEGIAEKDLFTHINHNQKVYKKIKNNSIETFISPVQQQRTITQANSLIRQKQVSNNETDIVKALNTIFVPPSIVINANNQMIFSQGQYMDMLSEKSGMISNNLFDMILPNLRADCRALVYRVRQTGEPDKGTAQRISQDGQSLNIYLYARSLSDELHDWVVISYLPITEKDTPDPNSVDFNDPFIVEIEQELNATRENLQTVIEQLETANEQLQLYNEELQSSNEEYQSTNEELQTVNEELQSTNEELLTVNEEYSAKATEQSRLSSDLSNIQESIEIPFFLINKEYRIQRFTRSCAILIDLNKIKIQDIFFALEWYVELPNFKPVIEQVESTLETIRTNVKIAEHYFQCQISPYFNADHQFDGYTIIFYETTDFENTRYTLNLEKQSAQITLETIMEGVLRINKNSEIEYANPCATSTLERDLDDLTGKNISKRLRIFHEDGKEFDIAGAVNKCVINSESYNTGSNPLLLKTQFGKDIFVEVSIAPLVMDDDVSGSVVAFRDVSERQEQLNRLEWQSQHDALTGLVNRTEMERRLDRAILSAKRDNIESSLLYIDLDQFKVINDTCGHLAGDSLLKQLSQLMSEMLRSRDTLARLGGDEFALILDRCSVLDAKEIAFKLQKKIQGYRFAWEDKVFRVGVSIGIASINRNISQISEVLSDADAACYAAKESGRNTIQVHSKDDELLERQRAQMRTISDINEAIESNLFHVYFHEVRQLSDNILHSWEVLIRMFNKKGEFLLPHSFLPAAERFGLINRIDSWVVQHTLEQISNFISEESGKEFPRININLSAHTIVDEGYLETFAKLIEKYKIPANNIAFEITETAAVSNLVKARNFMNKAKAMGCLFSLDDFGTGMSSLAYLRELPIDIVKIDKSFIENISEDPVKLSIVKSVNEVAHLLDLLVIAEGVETKDQIDCLKTLGIDAIQGFYIDKPIPFEQFVARCSSVS